MKKTNKKGVQLNQAFGAVLTLVLVATLIIIGIFMFSSLGDTFTGVSQSVVNESIALNNASAVTLAGAATCNFGSDVSVSAVYVDDTLLPAGNYTATTSGTVVLVDYNDGAGLVSYTYTNGGESCDATDDMVVQFGSYPTLIGLVGTIIFLGLVIGVLVASFMFSGRKV